MSNGKALGIDCGTMFFQVADENNNVKIIRNAFVELADIDDIEDVLKQNKWQYVKDGSKYYVIGEDSLRVAKMFPGKVELRRPLQSGVLNQGEEKKMIILNEIISSSIGKAEDNLSVVCTCVSSSSVDGSVDSTFHRARLAGMFKNLGWKVKIIEEGQAVVLSERPVMIEPDGTESPYSGIGCSFGAGRSNCVLSYKGIQVLGMSCAMGGDWIDEQVSLQTGAPLSQVTSKKEKELDFDNINYDDDVLFALDAFYDALLKRVFGLFGKKFVEVKSQFEAPLDIVVAGGTSMPKGFCNKLSKVVKGLNLPFVVKEIRHSADPRNSVVSGCLIQAIITQKKLQKGNGEDLADLLG